MIEAIKLTKSEQCYWTQPENNPLSDRYRKPHSTSREPFAVKAIDHVRDLIKPHLESKEKCFTVRSNHHNLLEFRGQIQAQFYQEGVDLSIRRGGVIFVKNVWQNFAN